MMSGMRKPSPISISSPRETMTSASFASVLRTRNTAAALLLTTMADSAPTSSASRRAGVDVALAAFAARDIVFEIRVAGGGCVDLRDGGSESGARPRLVCRTTPVALMTRRRDGREGCARLLQ